MATIDRDRLLRCSTEQVELFRSRTPRSAAQHASAAASMLNGVPMNWMARWAGPYPVVVDRAVGAHFRDIDGNDYVDLCLGDTGAMAGHAPPATLAAIAAQAAKGLTTMLPAEAAGVVAAELTRRFGLSRWQFALSATDANRFALRLARQATGRQRICVMNWCYHGTVDETLVTIDEAGRVVARDGRIGPPVDPALTTAVVEFNDVDALERTLAGGEIAAVLLEPAMTNIGIVHPDPGYHAAVRELTQATGTLLIHDETHTLCAGPGGYTAAHGLDCDMLTVGKSIAGGIGAAAYGLSDSVAAQVAAAAAADDCDVSGIGGTLAGNALSLAAMAATLTEVLTDDVFVRMAALAQRWADGVQMTIDRHRLDWSVTRLGARAEYWFCPTRPRNGADAARHVDHDLDAYLHLFALNRGILLTPFHNMALMCPATTEADVDDHTAAFADAVANLVADA